MITKPDCFYLHSTHYLVIKIEIESIYQRKSKLFASTFRIKPLQIYNLLRITVHLQQDILDFVTAFRLYSLDVVRSLDVKV